MDPEVAGRNTATGQASESSTLMKTAPEYPKSTADTSKSPFSTEFFTCLVAQPSPMSDLNDESPPPPLTTIDESGSVDLERSSVEDDPLPSGSSNTSRPIGFPSHFESLMSQSGSALEDISRGADILEANAKDIKIALMKSTGSGESSFIGKGKGKGRLHDSITQAERKGSDEETIEVLQREYPEVTSQLESTLSEVPALRKSLKARLNARIRAVRKPLRRR